MSVTASDYQSLKLRIKELEERVAELEKDNVVQAKIIAEQTKQIEELKAKLARYENPPYSFFRTKIQEGIKIQ